MDGKRRQTKPPTRSMVRGISMGVLLTFSAATSLKAGPLTTPAHLTVTMTLQSSISLIFQDNPSAGNPGFCSLSNVGTNNVGLDFGTASFTGGDSLSCVGYSHVGPATYQVSSGFDVVVSEANTTSPNYQLAAQISAAPPSNVRWLVNGTALTSAGFTTLDANDSYSAPVTKTLEVQVKNSVPAQALAETITFLATAN